MNYDELRGRSELSAAKKEFEDLLSSRAWGQLMRVMQAQIDGLQQEILFSPITSPEKLYDLERKKGKLEGKLELEGTVQGILAEIEVNLKQAIERGVDDETA